MPRSTTKRNLDWYFWAWNSPESIPWGGQVQDGGAVLGFSYHDLMARVKILGPDNAWKRLQEIIRWFDDVQAAGGYRKYYDGSREGSLQGGGTAGGLGLDMEFFESVMVPQVMLNGFLGFTPRADGFKLDPRLPSAWPELVVDRIRFQNLVLRIGATREAIEIRSTGVSPVPDGALSSAVVPEPLFLQLPEGDWKAVLLREDGSPLREARLRKRESDGALRLNWGDAAAVRLMKTNAAPAKTPAEH